MVTPSSNPLKPGYGFGSTLPPYSGDDKHKGQDFRYDPDHNVYAPEDGNAQIVPWNGQTKEGNMVVITNGPRRHALCHLKDFKVAPGPVKKGQAVGTMGATGSAQGAHLHWVLRIDGQLVDPMKYVNQGGDMPNEGDVHNVYLEFNNRKATPEEVKVYTSKSWSAGDGLYYGKVVPEVRHLKKALGEAQKTGCSPEERQFLDLRKKI